MEFHSILTAKHVTQFPPILDDPWLYQLTTNFFGQ